MSKRFVTNQCAVLMLLAPFLLTGYTRPMYEPIILEAESKLWGPIPQELLFKRLKEPLINFNTGKTYNFIAGDKRTLIKSAWDDYVIRALYHTPVINIYTTYDIIDWGNFDYQASGLLYYTFAKPSYYSYVRSFSFTEGDPLQWLPIWGFLFWAGSDQRAYLEKTNEQGLSLRDVAPSSKIIEASEERLSYFETFAEDFYDKVKDHCSDWGYDINDVPPSVIVDKILYGDLNGDGYEDLVLHVAMYAIGGTWRDYYYIIVTRKSDDEVLKNITDEVHAFIYHGVPKWGLWESSCSSSYWEGCQDLEWYDKFKHMYVEDYKP